MNTHDHTLRSPSTPATQPAANDNGDVRAASMLDELARDAAGGDLHAIGELANRYGPSLLAAARHRAVNEQDAEEAMQDFLANLSAGRARHFPPPRGRAFPWLLGLMGSLARKHRADEAEERRARRRAHGGSSDWHVDPEPEEDDDAGDRPVEEPGSLFDSYDAPAEGEEEDP